ncbi:MAG: hypothetical protein J0L92_03735 [Deltaproteobacteria bacterium]|nr:hypothetical protein [Deltaproteobacteria bacterium]
MDEFETYLRDYPRAMSAIRDDLRRTTRIALLDQLLIKLMFCVEARRLTYPPGEPGEVAKEMIAKLTQETFAFIGCMNFGSVVGAYTHIRSIHELQAAWHYVFHDPATVNQRSRRWREWPRVEAYFLYRRTQLDVAAGDVEPAELDRVVALAPWVVHVGPTDLAEWFQIYQKDFSKKHSPGVWHEGTISDRIRAVDTGVDYHTVSHAPHASPVGHRLAGERLKLVGWDPGSQTLAVEVALGALLQTIVRISESCGGVLLQFVDAEYTTFMRADGP